MLIYTNDLPFPVPRSLFPPDVKSVIYEYKATSYRKR